MFIIIIVNNVNIYQPTRQSPKTKTIRRQNPSPGPANNERPVPLQSRAATSSASLPLLEMNETETSRPSTDEIVSLIARPKVCGFLK